MTTLDDLRTLVRPADGRHRERVRITLDPAVGVAIGSVLVCLVVGLIGELVT